MGDQGWAVSSLRDIIGCRDLCFEISFSSFFFFSTSSSFCRALNVFKLYYTYYHTSTIILFPEFRV